MILGLVKNVNGGMGGRIAKYEQFQNIFVERGQPPLAFKRWPKISLDRQKRLLYHTKIVGILKLIMKKIVAITVTAVLTLSVLVSGASGYSDCSVQCMREMAKAHPHAAVESTKLRMPNCCSGRMLIPCEMNTTPEVKIPVCSIMSYRSTASANLFGIGMTPSAADTGHIRTHKAGLRLFFGKFYKDPPIYLNTLSLLC